MQREDSLVSQRAREWGLQDKRPPSPHAWAYAWAYAWACIPLRLAGACLSCEWFRVAHSPHHPILWASPPWQCSSLRNQKQYKPLLSGILFSPFNRLEVFYIRRKTTFELVVLFSELCFVFALIKFPLTQISIKCGSHQRQTLATPSLLFSGRRTCLCYGNASLEWAHSGKQAQPKHTLSALCFCFASRLWLRQRVFWGMKVLFLQKHMIRFLNKHVGGSIARQLRMLA